MLETSSAVAGASTLSVDLLPAIQVWSQSGKVTPVNGGVRVEGDAAAWAFAGLAPFAIPGRLQISALVTLEAGNMAIALVTAGGDVVQEQVLPPGQTEIRFDVAEGRQFKGIVLRTYVDASVAPRVLVHSLGIQALDHARYPLADAVSRQLPFILERRPALEKALNDLEVAHHFSAPQALTLAAVVADFKPTVILDLGTCSGGSSFSLALASPETPVYTFDIIDFWTSAVLARVSEPPKNITPIIADITQYDFAPLVKDAERVLIFWDAHGFEIAARVFSHIMPMLAGKPHVVFCHDISDNRYNDTDEARSYGGKNMFRGYDHYDRNMETTARANLSWMTTAVDQAIALTDFCYRNRMTLCSVDHELKTNAPDALWGAVSEQLYSDQLPSFDLTFFTMNETYLANFPAG